ncbi:hypothetical protein [Streptomyces sp. TRM49041]|uniref:hypothetical protein n=1 Tax=Streptomyces sp. TRM49041 TaxID=2603216 RepID=UPI00292A46CE|nr:hypothetical protein [Streptomyces sp. TRM49041]
MVGGKSAGGGLAAALAPLTRDRGGPGPGLHGFDTFAPRAALARDARDARFRRLRRVLG